MKTLREQTKDIMAERINQTAKREKLIKIGLTPSDIQQLFFAERQAKKQAAKERAEARQQRVAQVVEDTIARIFDRYTFGVEIECYNAPVGELLRTAGERGLFLRNEGYNHRDNDTYYKLVPDGSIAGSNPIECVSPILNGNNGGLDTLKTCCDTLNAVGARVNRSTGLHVHVGGRITQQQFVNTFVNYYFLENLIDTFMSPSRKDGVYCHALHNNINERELLYARTNSEVVSVFSSNYCHSHPRYFKINCMSWDRHNTIEFRQHQGTTDYEKISNWARFCIRLVDWSENNRLCANVNSIDDIAFLTADEKAYFKGRQSAFSA